MRPRRFSHEPRKASEKMISAHADAWLKLIEKLISQRAELPGNPEPREIAERVPGIVRKICAMAQIEPITKDEYHFLAGIYLTEEFFPDRMPAVKKAMEQAFDIVDEAIVGMNATNRNIDIDFMRELWRKANGIAARKAFQRAQEEARVRLAKKAGQVVA